MVHRAPVPSTPSTLPSGASLVRRILALFYEALLLCAALWFAGLVYVLVEQHLGWGHRRMWFQGYLLLFAGCYFVSQWVAGGQTLAMKTWRMRLVTAAGNSVGVSQAISRYALAVMSVLCLGIGMLWALIDEERQFLHDRLAGTRLVNC